MAADGQNVPILVYDHSQRAHHYSGDDATLRERYFEGGVNHYS